jgi:hypothetical protein
VKVIWDLFKSNSIYVSPEGQIAHRLYNPFHEGTGHGASAQYRKVQGVIRVFDVPEVAGLTAEQINPLWRDASSQEEELFKWTFAQHVEARLKEHAKKGPIRGIIDSKGIFKLITEKHNKGVVCSTSVKAEHLLTVMSRLEIPIPPKSNYRKYTRKQLIAAIKSHNKARAKADPDLPFTLLVKGKEKTLPLKKMTDEQLRFVLAHTTAYTKSSGSGAGRSNIRISMCNKIRDELDSRGLIHRELGLGAGGGAGRVLQADERPAPAGRGRGRGRPPKSTTLPDDGVAPIKRGRGRPRKIRD